MNEPKPDADFDSLTWDDGYNAGYAKGRQDGTDLTLAGAILIALIFTGLGFIFGMAVAQ